jgi:hypothetical protein
MSQTLFRTVPIVPQSRLQKWLKQQPEENAVIELNNLLASTPIKDISPTDVRAIEEKYAINLKAEFSLNLEEFYATYLNYCLKDRMLSGEELANLRHLQGILALDDKTTEKLSQEIKTAHIQNYVKKILTAQQFSPEEDEELTAILRNLNMESIISDKTRQQLEKYKLYWALRHLPLPVIRTDIAIQNNEICHFMIGNAKWYELRKVRYRSTSTDELTLIDQGSLYLTDKRIIFDGGKKMSTIQLTKILKSTPHSDGVTLGKDSGKDVTLRLPDRADIFGLMFERILRER